MTPGRAVIALSLFVTVAARAEAPPPPQPTDAPVAAPQPTNVAVLAAAPSGSPVTPQQPFVQVLSLRLMREKGILTQAEYESAMKDLADTLGTAAADATSLVVGRWSTTMYGFVEADFMLDSTQSFTDLPGNSQVLAGTALGANNPRLQFSVRNSRIGFRLRAPEVGHVRASAQLEMDFFGNQPTTATEAQFFNNPGFRIRHFFLKIETPIVDVLIGQYWQLFGWQSNYHPNTVEIQGVPGQLYSRTAQLRISKTIKSELVTLEVAVSAARPPERDSAIPDFQAGVRLAVNQWTGAQTMGGTGSTIAPLSVGVSGVFRNFSEPEFSAKPGKEVSPVNTAWGLAADLFAPLIPARPGHIGNSLSLTGEVAYGFGTADLYTSLSGGISNPALANPGNVSPAPTYTADVDNGLVTFDASGVLHAVGVLSMIGGLQYYLPVLDGRIWVSGNVSHTAITNLSDLGLAGSAKTRSSEDWADGNLFWDATSAVRFGGEYAVYLDHYADNKTTGTNHRVQLSAWYLF